MHDWRLKPGPWFVCSRCGLHLREPELFNPNVPPDAEEVDMDGRSCEERVAQQVMES